MGPMNFSDRDDLLFKLQEVADFFGKNLTDVQLRFWWDALKPFDREVALAALHESTATQKFMPKPVEVVTICELKRDQKKIAREETEPQPEYKPNPRLADAWRICLKEFHGLELPGGQDAMAMSLIDALDICIADAKRWNRLEAIPPEYLEAHAA